VCGIAGAWCPASISLQLDLAQQVRADCTEGTCTLPREQAG
jgi:hypothetical protein